MSFAQQEIPAEAAGAWASALLSAVQVGSVVVLDGQPAHALFTVSCASWQSQKTLVAPGLKLEDESLQSFSLLKTCDPSCLLGFVP